MEKKGLVGLIVVVGILLVVGFVWFIGNLDGGTEECVKVQTSCCPCSMGGTEDCVLASEVGEYEDDLAGCDEGLICAAVYNCKIESCEYLDGECVAR